MASDDFDVAVVALIVSLVALVVTASQLLAQSFATAEGSRRCSKAVIGPWNSLTSWKWHWYEWRFETVFTYPHFQLGTPIQLPLDTDLASLAGNPLTSKGAAASGVLSLDDVLLEPFASQQKAQSPQVLDGWIPLFITIRVMTSQYSNKQLHRRNPLEITSWPGIRLHRRSWDSMPFDVFRPLASTSLSDIAIIARRMGMRWKQFDPDKGVLVAEGAGHTLASVNVSGTGLVLRYNRVDRNAEQELERFAANVAGRRKQAEWVNWNVKPVFSWTREADMFAFGIFPGDSDLNLPNFITGSRDDMLRIINEVLDLRDYLNWGDVYKRSWLERYEINELMCLASPNMRLRHSAIALLSFPKYGASIFTYRTAWNTHTAILRRRPKDNRSSHLERNLAALEKNYRKKSPNNDNDSERMQRWETIHDLYDETTRYFQDIIRKNKDFYWNLLRAHFSKSPIAAMESRARCRGENKPPPRDLEENDPDQGLEWRSEQVNMMWDEIPHYVSFMAGCDLKPDSLCKDAALVEEAWITLFIRGLCWAALNEQNNNPPADFFIPSQYYGSQLPVFLL